MLPWMNSINSSDGLNELNCEKEANKDLEKRIRQLERELSNERGKANKFASMLFGLKSEKLKLSDIKVEDRNSIVVEEISESEITNAGEDESAGEKEKKTEAEKDNDTGKRKSGVQDGHKGNGRKIPKGLQIVDRIIRLPEGEVIHGIPAENWTEQNGMDEVSYTIRKKSNGTWNVLSGVNILLLRITPLAFPK